MAHRREIELLLERSMVAEAQLQALELLVTTILARAASNSHDPNMFIMTALDPLDHIADAFDPSDEVTGSIGEEVAAMRDRIETLARSLSEA